MAPKGIVCAGCRKSIINKEFVGCCSCKQKFDISCANLTVKQFLAMTPEKKSVWKCANCLSKVDKIDSSNIFDDESSCDETLNITKRKKTIVAEKIGTEDYITEHKLRDIVNELAISLERKMKDIVSNQLKQLNEQITDFQNSVTFFNQQFETLKSIVSEKDTVIKKLQSDNEQLLSVTKELNNRLCLVEQRQRESNLEVNGVPEHKSENLINTVTQIAKTVGETLADCDILHATRVAKLNKDNRQPRSVIIKLRSPRLRDNLLAAVSKFNKKNPKEKLNSNHIGIGGNPVPVFLAEHLCPSGKHLHAVTRKMAKDLGYKFVWVRNGRIFIRKDEFSPAILIRNIDSLSLLTKND